MRLGKHRSNDTDRLQDNGFGKARGRKLYGLYGCTETTDNRAQNRCLGVWSVIAVVQRVTRSSVTVNESVVGAIGHGLNVLLGVAKGDEESDAHFLAAKISHLRIFEDDQGKMNRSLLDTGAQMLVVSQFTLLGDCRKGRRPSFVKAAKPDLAERLYEYFVGQVKQLGIDTQTGRFGAMMRVEIVNDGPVTLLVQSR